jgi:DNA-binding beta-propeller fold protein YncE
VEYYRYQEALRHPSITAVDSCNNRIQKFDSNGNFITKWGTLGTGDGQFSRPKGIGINSKGLVYVAETNNARVQIFAPSIPKQDTSVFVNILFLFLTHRIKEEDFERWYEEWLKSSNRVRGHAD